MKDVVVPVGVGAGEAVAAAERPRTSLLRAYFVLTKFRLNALVVFTTALGFVVGTHSLAVPEVDYPKLMWTCLGTLLAAMGASAFNQAIERKRDARMNRTKNRPVASGRISAAHAAYFGLLATIAGVAILCPTSNGLTAVLAVATVILYAAVYTPLKIRSTTNTLVGAVVGGIPPMIGWTAATGSVSAGAWALGAILFAWQIPHFLALAWMYKDDYARGGYKMVSTVDPTGTRTAVLAIVYSLALIPPCAALFMMGYCGFAFGFLSMALTLVLAMAGVMFAQSRSRKDARRLFLASILYLPLLCTLLLLDVQSPNAIDVGIAGYTNHSGVPVIDPDSVKP